MKILLSILTLLTLSATANASICALDADVSGRSWHLFVGHSHLEGEGVINCLNDEGEFVKVMDVYVEAEGGGFGLGFTKIENAHLHSTG